MYYNDDFRSSDQYRYTNRDQLPRDDYAPDPDRTPAHQPVLPKKQGFFPPHRPQGDGTGAGLRRGRRTAGWGGASIANSSGRAEKATIQQSSRQPVSVQVKTVDGQTKMEPGGGLRLRGEQRRVHQLLRHHHQHLRPDHPDRLQRQRLHHHRGRLCGHQLPLSSAAPAPCR